MRGVLLPTFFSNIDLPQTRYTSVINFNKFVKSHAILKNCILELKKFLTTDINKYYGSIFPICKSPLMERIKVGTNQQDFLHFVINSFIVLTKPDSRSGYMAQLHSHER